MTNYKEIINMNANSFSMRAIANSLNCHRSTVSRCLLRAKEEELIVPLDPNLTNAELHEIFILKSLKEMNLLPFLILNKWMKI